MPVITLDVAKKLSKEQKGQLVKELTETAAKIMGSPKEVFYVFLKENDYDNVGVGGELFSDRIKK